MIVAGLEGVGPRREGLDIVMKVFRCDDFACDQSGLNVDQ